MTYKLTITDDEGRVVAFCQIDKQVEVERTRDRADREYWRYGYNNDQMMRPFNDMRVANGYNLDKLSFHVRALPMKDGTLIKYFKHKPVDKLAGE